MSQQDSARPQREKPTGPGVASPPSPSALVVLEHALTGLFEMQDHRLPRFLGIATHQGVQQSGMFANAGFEPADTHLTLEDRCIAAQFSDRAQHEGIAAAHGNRLMKQIIELPDEIRVGIGIGLDHTEHAAQPGLFFACQRAAGQCRGFRFDKAPDRKTVEIILKCDHPNSQRAPGITNKKPKPFEATERITQRRAGNIEACCNSPLLYDCTAGKTSAQNFRLQCKESFFGQA
jgi:hypothetical protein